MSDDIKLFQTDRAWSQIRDEVFALTDQYHRLGVAQNGEPALLLEAELCQRFNRKYCVVTGSCTDALDLALQALKLPRNARVAVGNYTFTATAHAIRRAGYRVVPVDVTENYTIDVSKIGKVDAVVPVDLFGNMSDWRSLNRLSTPVVNDAAQSLESHDWESHSAAKGVVSCVSFSPSKTISSWGSGGALLTDNEDIATLCRRLRIHGKLRNDDIAVGAGLNSIMSTMEVAAVLVGLRYSGEWQERRTRISEHIRSNCSLVSANDSKTLMKNTYQKLVFQSDQRDQLVNKLNSQGIGAAVHYRQTVNDETLYATKRSFPVSDRLKAVSFTVPNQHTLTDAEVERIVKALK
jgi:dTDP-4-amino-4,6-dideoxygalactose transaminase